MLAEMMGMSLELTVQFNGQGYSVLYKKDGVIAEYRRVETRQQVVDLARSLIEVVGSDLYVKLQTNGTEHLRDILDLALALSREGLIISLSAVSSAPRVCMRPLT